MILTVAQTELFIGANSDTEQALNLSLLPKTASFYSLPNETKAIVSFCQLQATNSKVERCIGLIKQVLTKLSAKERERLTESVVFLLLPVFEHQLHSQQSEAFNDFIVEMSKEIPELFENPLNKCFPFGSASLPIAFKSIEEVFSHGKAESVVLLSVDSLYHEMSSLLDSGKLNTLDNAGNIIPSEGAIYCKLHPSNQGLSVDFYQQETVPEKQVTQAISNLFIQASSVILSQPPNVADDTPTAISVIYLPRSSDDATQPWLDSYQYLAKVITVDSKIFQSSLFTDELGCVSGLYNFLHIYNEYQNQGLIGISGQLEVSSALYQAFALYSWKGKV